MQDLTQFEKRHDLLICVDSDGCAMDTMDIKHIRAFGPCMVAEWALFPWQEAILARWNEINLYSMTRGINRFKGLATALSEIHTTYCPIDGIDALCRWVETSPELSNEALERAIAQDPVPVLKKALAWSDAVNRTVKALPADNIRPFPLAKEALCLAHQTADIAIVSSANLAAVLEEWNTHGLLPHTDLVLSQNVGSKTFCIAELMKKGYAPSCVLMCGDAPGDWQAAQQNGVFFFPILVRHEEECWREFMEEALPRLAKGTFGGTYQEQKIRAFHENLK